MLQAQEVVLLLVLYKRGGADVVVTDTGMIGSELNVDSIDKLAGLKNSLL